MLMYHNDSHAALHTLPGHRHTHTDQHIQTHTPSSGEVMCKVTASPCGSV